MSEDGRKAGQITSKMTLQIFDLLLEQQTDTARDGRTWKHLVTNSSSTDGWWKSGQQEDEALMLLAGDRNVSRPGKLLTSNPSRFFIGSPMATDPNHGQHVPTPTAAAVWRANTAVSKAAWWPWPLTFKPWKWCPSQCDVGYLCANFGLPRPPCSWLRADVRDRRQTSDRRQTASSLNALA